MPSGGIDESAGAPPVIPWRSIARATSAVLLHDSNFYSGTAVANGFYRVPAIPPATRLAQPANANSAASIRAAQVYTQQPSIPFAKNTLQRRFGE